MFELTPFIHNSLSDYNPFGELSDFTGFFPSRRSFEGFKTDIKDTGSEYIVEAEWLWRLVGSVNFEDRDSLNYFQRILRKSGVIDKLVAAGVKDGDTVTIYNFSFDFVT